MVIICFSPPTYVFLFFISLSLTPLKPLCDCAVQINLWCYMFGFGEKHSWEWRMCFDWSIAISFLLWLIQEAHFGYLKYTQSINYWDIVLGMYLYFGHPAKEQLAFSWHLQCPLMVWHTCLGTWHFPYYWNTPTSVISSSKEMLCAINHSIDFFCVGCSIMIIFNSCITNNHLKGDVGGQYSFCPMTWS